MILVLCDNYLVKNINSNDLIRDRTKHALLCSFQPLPMKYLKYISESSPEKQNHQEIDR